MDKLKSTVFGAISALIIFFFVILAGVSVSPAAEAYAPIIARVLYDDVPLVDENGEVLMKLNADDEVEVTGEATAFGCPVTVSGASGYIEKEFLYFPDESTGALEIRSVKVLAEGVGKEVELKAAPSKESETAETLGDGVRLDVTECDSADYYRIVGGDYRNLYIAKENVTTSLTRNQRVAVIVIAVSAVAAAMSFGLIYLHRNRDRFKNKR